MDGDTLDTLYSGMRIDPNKLVLVY